MLKYGEERDISCLAKILLGSALGEWMLKSPREITGSEFLGRARSGGIDLL